MPYLIVEAGSVNLAGRRFDAGVHELGDESDTVRSEAEALEAQGVSHVMYTEREPKEDTTVYQHRIDVIRSLNPAAAQAVTKQQLNQLQYETIQSALSEDEGAWQDRSENVALSENDMKVVDHHTAYGEKLGQPVRQASEVLTSDDLKATTEKAAERAKNRQVGTYTASAGELAASGGLDKAPQEKDAAEKRADSSEEGPSSASQSGDKEGSTGSARRKKNGG